MEILSSSGNEQLGPKFKPIHCLNCKKWLCDAHIFRGRLRLKCPNCGKITVLMFRRRK